VDGGPARLPEGLLDPAKPVVDGAPARVDQVDEQAEVVHAGAPFCEQLRLDPLEPPDRLVREPPNLGELARDRTRLDADAVANRLADAIGK
jgi:hypothetical protein